MIERKRKPTHPGAIIKFDYLEELNMSVSKLALILGVSRKTLSKIVNEHASITPQMALRLSQAFGTTPELWLNLQRNYDLWIEAHSSTEWKHVERVVFPAA